MSSFEKNISTSITESNKNIIVSLSGDIFDDELEKVKESVLYRAFKKDLNGAVFDFSAIRVVDSFTYGGLVNTSKALELLGLKVVWAGLSPGVVSALIDLNVDTDNGSILTAVNLEEGLILLSQMRTLK